eukprot:TRINITY_DN6482_c0_g1_i2.p1 TRINITY_DN6482_c0_g1~~TRINITY_DN6482_c0_g1_i2.p1  ORF type:complete len:600 (+),score=93.96 TRINITY_DN6482_c0_g1_i2:53-1801(+)
MSLVHAFSELLANASDANDGISPVCSVNKDMLKIRNLGRALDAKAFVIGHSVSRDCDEAIGTHGLGLKDAIAIIMRHSESIALQSRHGSFKFEVRPHVLDKALAVIYLIHAPEEVLDGEGTLVEVSLSKEASKAAWEKAKPRLPALQPSGSAAPVVVPTRPAPSAKRTRKAAPEKPNEKVFPPCGVERLDDGSQPGLYVNGHLKSQTFPLPLAYAHTCPKKWFNDEQLIRNDRINLFYRQLLNLSEQRAPHPSGSLEALLSGGIESLVEEACASSKAIEAAEAATKKAEAAQLETVRDTLSLPKESAVTLNCALDTLNKQQAAHRTQILQDLQLFLTVKPSCQVAEIFPSGSFAKATRVPGKSDIDLVCFVNDLPAEQMAQPVQQLLIKLQNEIKVQFFDRLVGDVRVTSHSVQFCLEGTQIDLLPVSIKLKHDSLEAAVAARKQAAKEDESFHSAAMARHQVEWFKKEADQHSHLRHVVRLIKLWTSLRAWPKHTKPRSCLIEALVATAANGSNGASASELVYSSLKVIHDCPDSMPESIYPDNDLARGTDLQIFRDEADRILQHGDEWEKAFLKELTEER